MSRDRSQPPQPDRRVAANGATAPRAARQAVQVATPRPTKRPYRAMPKQTRDAPPPARQRRRRYTVFGRDWPLPIAPAATLLVLILAVVIAVAWFAEGRYQVTPAEAAKLVLPFKADKVESVQVTTADGDVTFRRGPDGKLTGGGPPPTPTPQPSPGATLAPVVLSAGTRLEGLLNQLAEIKITRVLQQTPSNAPEFGLDKPQLVLKVVPKSGEPVSLAMGALNPEKTDLYVRREERKDTVLVSRYTLEDLIKVAGDIIKESKAA